MTHNEDNPWASPAHQTPEVLETPGTVPGAQVLESAPRRRRTGLVVGLVVGGVVVASAAGAAAFVGSRLGGGGDQPEQHLPGSAVAFAKLDLDPSAGQKIDAIRFLRRLPQTKDDVAEDDADLRKAVYDGLFEDTEGAPSWDEVEPWLGQRVGVAVLDTLTDGEPDVAVAVQVTDEEAARTTLTGAEAELGAVVSDGWAVLARTQALADAAAEGAESAPLSDDEDFAADADALGEDGIATAWGDLAAVRSLVEESGAADVASSVASLEGRVSVALRFDGSKLELAGRGTGTDVSGYGDGPSGLADLPATSIAGFGAAVSEGAVEKSWDENIDELADVAGVTPQDIVTQADELFGLTLPDDLATLLGRGVALGVGSVDTDEPVIGLRGRSVDGDDATDVVTTLADLAGGAGFALEQRPTDDGWVLATTGEYADALAAGGDLGEQEKVTSVVPDIATAPVAAYLDLEALADLAEKDGDDEAAQTLRGLGAVGMSVSTDGDAATFTVRLGG